jgi:hypothetical protein
MLLKFGGLWRTAREFYPAYRMPGGLNYLAGSEIVAGVFTADTLSAVDRLVELAMSQRGVFGARLTGGGFGGAVVIAAAGGSASDVASEVQAAYAVEAGRQVTILVPARTT